ncbi:GAF domain-containing protein [Paenibacillus sp. TRM 82003]|uniref:GAF domain-containing protein n=1 Tax=Kineococcus sp. TRM81007 TaxID=2925831 RepID=UPI001F5A42C1|nr:GAF domain-containing protein [Kineococcus sp. TRM81007]MCI2239641.1 GAF domain-containing protein [Kineococcus sp. TRM81007]MCI3926796.1 GAF domain-containing protein [Paenibacillus sp. TRM 82003]
MGTGERARGGLLAVREDWLASCASGRAGTPLPGAREVVSQSWWRSRSTGLDPDRVLAPLALDGAGLRERRTTHPLAPVLPTARRLLLDEPLGVPVLMAVSDVDGTLLWVEGDAVLRRAAESMSFLPGARWSEEAAGTNAPGTALALSRPVRVRSGEHYATAAARWSCSAAPVRDPATGRVLGVLDLTGGDDLGRERALALVRAAVGAVEGELRVAALRRGLAGARPAPAAAGLRLLGGEAVLRAGGGEHRLSLRHAEVLLLLLTGPAAGWSAGALAGALDARGLAPVSVRAEVHRLRAVLAERTGAALGLTPSPYRLTGEVACDALRVRDALREGRVGDAVDGWGGDLLPASDAPGVREVREELVVALRTAVLEGEDDDALLRFSRGAAGRDDPQVVQELLRRLAPGHPARGEVLARAARLAGRPHP